MNNTFIYVLKDPTTNEIRYVGKSNNPYRRLSSHLNHSKKNITYRDCWITSLLSKGLKPVLQILEEVSYDTWEEREIFWISKFNNLTNILKGGTSHKGKESPSFKRVVSEEFKYNLKQINQKTILQFNLDFELIKIWACMADAARSIDVNPSSLNTAYKQVGFTCKNYIWIKPDLNQSNLEYYKSPEYRKELKSQFETKHLNTKNKRILKAKLTHTGKKRLDITKYRMSVSRLKRVA